MEYTRERLERYPEFSAMRVYDEVKKRGYVIGLLCHKTRFNGGMVLRITLAARNFEKGPEGRPFTRCRIAQAVVRSTNTWSTMFPLPAHRFCHRPFSQ